MRCEAHPDTDAVGRCVSCGRGVCSVCKIRFGEVIHCKECVEAGRIAGKGTVPPPRPLPPKVSMAMGPAPPMGPPIPTRLRPEMIPFLNWGWVGCMVGCCISFAYVIIFMGAISFYGYTLPFMIIFSILFLLPAALIGYSFYGFNKVYHAHISLHASLVMCATFSIYLAILLFDTLVFRSSMETRVPPPFGTIAGYVAVGVGLILFIFIMRRIPFMFMVPKMRKDMMDISIVLLLISAIMLMALIPLVAFIEFAALVIAWVPMGMGFLVLGGFIKSMIPKREDPTPPHPSLPSSSPPPPP